MAFSHIKKNIKGQIKKKLKCILALFFVWTMYEGKNKENIHMEFGEEKTGH